MSDPDTIPTTLRPGEPDKRPTPRLCASHHADVARSKPIEKPKAPRKMEVTNTELRLKRVLYMGCCIRVGSEREKVITDHRAIDGGEAGQVWKGSGDMSVRGYSLGMERHRRRAASAQILSLI